MAIEEIAAYVRQRLASHPPKPLSDEQVHKLRTLFRIDR